MHAAQSIWWLPDLSTQRCHDALVELLGAGQHTQHPVRAHRIGQDRTVEVHKLVDHRTKMRSAEVDLERKEKRVRERQTTLRGRGKVKLRP